MTNRTAATRYARALFDVALQEKGNLQEIEAALGAFVNLFTQHPLLQKVLLNPAVPTPRKRATVVELNARAAPPPVLAKLLVLLAGRDRLVLLPEMLAEYRDRLLRHQQVVRAEVTTAAPLAADRAQAIERRLSQATGGKVTVATKVDPAIVGGVVARIGSTVYDGSVTRQLEKMRARLTEGSRG